MFIIPIILSAALDMSLPEFQPQVDLSGNYIIGEFDVSDGDFKVIETEELPDGLTVEAPAEDVDVSNDLVETNLLGGTRALETITVTASVKSGYRVNSGVIQVHSGDNLYYVYLTAGIEYEIHGSNLYSAQNLNKDTVVHSFSSSTYTPESNIYLVKNNGSFYVTYTTGTPDPEDPSNNEPGGGDVSGDDTNGNEPDNPSSVDFDDTAILEVLHDIQMQLRCILFVCIWKFILPLAMKIRDHVFGLKHE